MKILSIDQSTTRIGYCLWDNKNYVESGVFEISRPTSKKKIKTKNKNIDEEYQYVYKGFDFIVSLINKYEPNLIVMEEVFMGRNAAVLKKLGTLKGMVLGYCKALEINTSVVYPTTWKSFIRVHSEREKEKQDVLNYFKSLYKEDITEDDESDSIGIGYYYVNKYL